MARPGRFELPTTGFEATYFSVKLIEELCGYRKIEFLGNSKI